MSLHLLLIVWWLVLAGVFGYFAGCLYRDSLKLTILCVAVVLVCVAAVTLHVLALTT